MVIRVLMLARHMKLSTINAIKTIRTRHTETAIARIMLVIYHEIY